MPQGFLTKPLTTKPRTIADEVAEGLDPSNTNVGDRGIVKPFAAGAIQGLGDVMSDFTSPLGIASLAMGPIGRMKGLGSIGRLMQEARPAEKIFDEGGRLLTGAKGYAGPLGTPARLTEGTKAAERALGQLKTPIATKFKPPRVPK
jgi:hypothetical protein